MKTMKRCSRRPQSKTSTNHRLIPSYIHKQPEESVSAGVGQPLPLGITSDNTCYVRLRCSLFHITEVVYTQLFDFWGYTMKIFHSLGHVVGGTLLIAGTAVGVGMLALPVATGPGGFIPSITIYLICWAFMLCTGLLLVEA